MSDENTEALPPLPEPAIVPLATAWPYKPHFTADQMRDHARAALAQRQQVPEGWREALMAASIALRQLSERAKQVKAALDADLPDGTPVHPQSRALTWPISTALLAIDKVKSALTAAPSAQAEPQVSNDDAELLEFARRKGLAATITQPNDIHIDFTLEGLRNFVAALTAAPQAAQAQQFSIGQTVRKKSGSAWSGRIVGTYSTALTPEGYAVESDAHPGSVQIYPAAALEAA